VKSGGLAGMSEQGYSAFDRFKISKGTGGVAIKGLFSTPVSLIRLFLSNVRVMTIKTTRRLNP
jgi:uncharacterized spore protein YtfJ